MGDSGSLFAIAASALHQTIKAWLLVHNGRVKHVFPSAMECDQSLKLTCVTIWERMQLSRLRAIFIPYRLLEVWKKC